VTTDTAVQKPAQSEAETRIVAALGPRSVVLVGMMGAGKSSIGRRLAARLTIPFVDADSEIEAAAGMTIPEIFAKHGEPYFRAGEARVIARLLDAGPQVLATGGGAVMDASTRQLIAAKSVSVWLKADVRCCCGGPSGAASVRWSIRSRRCCRCASRSMRWPI
jgi:shikimate kinase